MAKIEPCTCGHMPSFSCVQVAEDAVESQFACQRGQRVPGGGYTGGCGEKQGPVAEDAFSDRDTALVNWNAMMRAERRRASEVATGGVSDGLR